MLALPNNKQFSFIKDANIFEKAIFYDIKHSFSKRQRK